MEQIAGQILNSLGVTVWGFIIIETLWPIVVGKLIEPKMLDPFLQRIHRHRLKEDNPLYQAWIRAFQDGFSDCHREWQRGPWKAIRRSKEESYLSKCKEARDRLKNEINIRVVLGGELPDVRSVLMSADSKRSPNTGDLSTTLKNEILSQFHKYVSEDISEYWQFICDHLFDKAGQSLRLQLQDEAVRTGYSDVVHALVIDLLEDIQIQGVPLQQQSKMELVSLIEEAVMESMQHFLSTVEEDKAHLSEIQKQFEIGLKSLHNTFDRGFNRVYGQLDEVKQQLSVLQTGLAELGFQDLENALCKGLPSIQVSPWPIALEDQDIWPYWQDFESSMVARPSCMESALQVLRNSGVCLITGLPASGKTVAAKYLGYHLQNEGYVVFIFGQQRSSHENEYEGLDHVKLLKLLRSRDHTATSLCLIFDNAQYAPEKIEKLYTELQRYPLPNNIYILIIADNSLLNASRDGKRLERYVTNANQRIDIQLTVSTVVNFAEIVLQRKSHGKVLGFDEKDHDVLQHIHNFCKGNWILLRSLFQTFRYHPNAGSLWPDGSFIREDEVSKKVSETLFDGIPDAAIDTFYLIASLTYCGVWVQHHYLENTQSLNNLQILKDRGLVITSRDGKAYSAGHRSIAEMHLQTRFGHRLYDNVSVYIRKYLIGEPGNYLSILLVPRLLGVRFALTRALRGEKDKCKQHLVAILCSETDLVRESWALYDVYQIDRGIARELFHDVKQDLRHKLAIAALSLDPDDLVTIFRNLRVVDRVHSSEITNVLDEQQLADAIRCETDLPRLVSKLTQLKQLYMIDCQLVHRVRDLLITYGFFHKLYEILKTASFAQIGKCLVAIVAFDYNRARGLLDHLGHAFITEKVLECQFDALADPLREIGMVHPYFLDGLTLDWETNGHTTKLISEQMRAWQALETERLEIVANLAETSSALGARLAQDIDLDSLKRDWLDGGLRIDQLGRTINNLYQAHRTRAILFVRDLDPELLRRAVRNGMDYPYYLGKTIENIHKCHRQGARLCLDEALLDRDTFYDHFNIWRDRASLNAIGVFLKTAMLVLGAKRMDVYHPEAPQSLPFTLLTPIRTKIKTALVDKIYGGKLEDVGLFLSTCASSDMLTHMLNPNSLVSTVADAIEDDKNSLEDIVSLLDGLEKISHNAAARVVNERRERLLTRLESRTKRHDINLEELGRSLTSIGKIDRSILTGFSDRIHWDMLREEIASETRPGRIAVLLRGFDQARLSTDSNVYNLGDLVVASMIALLSYEPEVSIISESVDALLKLDHSGDLARRVVEELDIEVLISLLETEPRIDRISTTLRVLSLTQAQRQLSLILQALDLATLASRVRHESQLFITNQLVYHLSQASWVCNFEDDLGISFLVNHIPVSVLHTQVSLERDAGVVANMLWNLVISSNTEKAQELLENLDPETIARRFAGFRDTATRDNISELTSAEMLERTASGNQLGKMAGFLSAVRQCNRGWACSFFDCLVDIFTESTDQSKGARDFLMKVAQHTRWFHFAWLTAELERLDPNLGQLSLDQMHTWIRFSNNEELNRQVPDIGWALWILAQYGQYTEQASSFAHQVSDAIGKQSIVSLVQEGEKPSEVAGILGGFRFVPDLFPDAVPEWLDELLEDTYNRAAVIAPWLLRAVRNVWPECAACQSSEVCLDWEDFELWQLASGQYRLWRIELF